MSKIIDVQPFMWRVLPAREGSLPYPCCFYYEYERKNMELSRTERVMAMIFLTASSALEASDSPDWSEERSKTALDALAATASAWLQDGRSQDEVIALVRLVDAEAQHVAAGARGCLA